MARQTHTTKSPSDYTGAQKFRPTSNSLYIGKVKRTADPQRMGRVQVHVNAFGGIENDVNTWIWCSYLTPFYGVTPGDLTVAGTNDWSQTQKSYGMWMPPPDIDTQVAVMFDSGNLAKGYIIGYPMDQYMNTMIPGNPSSRLKRIDEDSSDYDSELIQQKIASTPITEYNKSINVRTSVDKERKPIHPFVETLVNQGLANDDTRGNTTSSARRETPSQGFGISTPGPVDFFGQKSGPEIGNFHGAIQDKDGRVKSRANSRQGGHTFVMDDGTPQDLIDGEIRNVRQNELIRLRTRTGHQILMHDTEDLIYIGTASGNAWIELTQSGKIDIFAGDSVSVHTKSDFNFKADRDVNIEAGRNINMKAVGEWSKDRNPFHDEKLDDVSTGAIRFESSAQTFIKVGGEGRIEVGGDLKLESLQGHIDIKASQVADTVDDVVRQRKDVRIHATGDVDILAGNSANADDSLTSNINLQAVTDADSTVGNFNLKTTGKVNVDSVLDTTLKSSAKLQVSNAGTDIDGGNINFNSGTVSATTAGESATADKATIQPLRTHILPQTDTEFVFPYQTDSRSVEADGKVLLVKSIMKRVPVHEEWIDHENKDVQSVTLDRTDREYVEPNPDKEEKVANDLTTRV
mgnify:CR=1 FL=1